MTCPQCKDIQNQSKDDNAMCGDCGRPYYQGKIDMATDLMIIVANKNMTREMIIEKCKKEIKRCNTVKMSFGLERK
jgi:hypothetical protein